MPTPCVSVLMTTYNGAATIGASINSVLSQSFRDFEFLIVDDGSHLYDHQRNALEAFWPLLLAGGFYLIEDVPSLEVAGLFSHEPGYMLIDTRAASGRFDDLLVLLRKPF